MIDDESIARRVLREELELLPEVEVVGEAEDGRQAVALSASVKPDVAVLDIGMPNLNGIEAAKQIADGESGATVVILSMHADETYILRALKAGARGYLLKDSAESDLVCAIRSVAEGKSFFSPAVSKVMLEDYVKKLQRTGSEDSYDLLTPREREVMALVVAGLLNKQIAAELGTSEITVKLHRAQVMHKMRAASLAELVRTAERLGAPTPRLS